MNEYINALIRHRKEQLDKKEAYIKKEIDNLGKGINELEEELAGIVKEKEALSI